MTECEPSDGHVRAFLLLIRFADHYPNEPRESDYTSVYGNETFGGFTRHPQRFVRRWGHRSDAAGAYQILGSTWREAVRKGWVHDFSPAAQDRIAYEKLRSRGALPFVCSGDVAGAVARLRSEWTSLPGAAQSRMSLDVGQEAFTRYGGVRR